jgi:integrase/recombinase XerD
MCAALTQFDEWLNDTDQSFDEVGPIEIEDFVTALSAKGYAPASCGLYFNNVREFYKYLVRAEVIEENPANNADRNHISSLTEGRRKSEESEIIYLTSDEVDAMVENAPTPRLRNRLIIKLLYHTGVRAQECASIQLKHIFGEERRIRVYSSKTDEWRSVYYRPSLDLLLKEWIDGGYRDAYGSVDQSLYLFPSKQSEKLSPRTVSEIVATAAENCGIQEVMYTDANGSERRKYAAHSLRHSFAYWYLDNGGDIRTLQRLLGHHDISVTEDYLTLVDSDTKDIYERVSSSATD